MSSSKPISKRVLPLPIKSISRRLAVAAAGGALLLLGALTPVAAYALQYRSVAVNVAMEYDAPSHFARRLYLVTRYYPVEVIVSLEKWVKVRDWHGDLAWIEKKNLGVQRTVLVTVPLADIRQAPRNNAPIVFQAAQNVALQLLGGGGIGSPAGPSPPGAIPPGWLKVRHPDGQEGYVNISQVWGT